MSDAEQNRKPIPDDSGGEPAQEPEAEQHAEAEKPDPDALHGEQPEAEASDAEEPEAAEDEGPKPRKRKRKRKKQREPRLRPARDTQGRDRPRFLLSFPHDPELDRLIEAYETGDYATVRRDAPRLAERTEDGAVRDAARELRRRIDPDPLARYLLLTGIALLAFLVIWVYAGRGH